MPKNIAAIAAILILAIAPQIAGAQQPVSGIVKNTGTANSAPLIEGRAIVIDGDTIEISGQRIRLWGIDAPEIRQTCKDADGAAWPCGEAAATALAQHVANRTVACKQIDTDVYGRTVAACRTPDAPDLAEALVSAGLAVDYQRYSGGHYALAEKSARAALRGIWRGPFTRPEEWRHDPKNRKPFGRGE